MVSLVITTAQMIHTVWRCLMYFRPRRCSRPRSLEQGAVTCRCFLSCVRQVELIDTEEEETCMVAMDPGDLSGDSFTRTYTHMEIHPSMILGTHAMRQNRTGGDGSLGVSPRLRYRVVRSRGRGWGECR
jgi:DNA-directed RNA polymerase beta subunit